MVIQAQATLRHLVLMPITVQLADLVMLDQARQHHQEVWLALSTPLGRVELLEAVLELAVEEVFAPVT